MQVYYSEIIIELFGHQTIPAHCTPSQKYIFSLPATRDNHVKVITVGSTI